MKELSADPGHFVPFLFLINKHMEQERIEHKPFDVRRLPLPKLFSVLPAANTKWRFITLNVNALSSFVNHPRPKGYQEQFDMYFRVFNFKNIRFNKE